MTAAHLPIATYRLQFNAGFRLSDATAVADYLAELGITDAYASPLFRSREQSSHGYDVIDYDQIDPDLGTTDDFQTLTETLRRHGLGLMMDIVPNHMGIDDWHNAWWQDVLEAGPSSPYAKFFDIDWEPPKESLRQRILLPILGDQFGRVLENGELTLVYDDGRFYVSYYDHRFPVATDSIGAILGLALTQVQADLPADNPYRMELESILTAIGNLPPRGTREPEAIELRHREKEVIRLRLSNLRDRNVAIARAITKAVAELNGHPGDPRSYDRLEALLTDQPYRLCDWRVASDEINYRRFFDINALAAIRVEDPDVFAAVHAMVFRFLRKGWVTALRVDHPDGLLDPQQYFTDLQRLYREATAAEPDRGSIYVVAEKILVGDETLPVEWPVCGTTGYDFLNLAGGVLVDRRGAAVLLAGYEQFIGRNVSFREVLYQSKRTILDGSMASELYVLANHLERISDQHRWSRDFTRSALHRALRETIACFPVYRTYIRPAGEKVREEDRRVIRAAIRDARRRNPTVSPAYFDFVASVLLLEHPDGLSDDQRRQRVDFVLKFQQVTGPVMAKGMEDTAFYRWYPLAALDEVGGEPAGLGTSLDRFHRRTAERAAAWPFSLLATATHDTKRGEDVRARLAVLSEIPDRWLRAIRQWHEINAPLRTEIEGSPAPEANEEYLLYQTLVGTWPVEGLPRAERDDYTGRIADYMLKAIREAKINTNWTNPDESYEQAVLRFTRDLLDPAVSGRFLAELDVLVAAVAPAGWINSLSQCVLKVASPGVADFYQGNELWDFHLVDPDNRAPVDFRQRRELLGELKARAAEDLPRLAAELAARPPDERLKLFVTWRSLVFRRDCSALLLHGSYVPLAAEGPRAEHLCAFIREHQGRWALAVVPRLVAAAVGPGGEAWWEGTRLALPPDAPQRWRHVMTGQTFPAEGQRLELARLLVPFPVALLEGPA